MVVVQRKADLLEIVLARQPPRRLAGRLHGRQEERHEDADDEDHHEKLNERESTVPDVVLRHGMSEGLIAFVLGFPQRLPRL